MNLMLIVKIWSRAGVGRTGAFLVLDIMLDRIQNQNDIDIFNCVSAMRRRRIFMVQTEVGVLLILITSFCQQTVTTCSKSNDKIIHHLLKETGFQTLTKWCHGRYVFKVKITAKTPELKITFQDISEENCTSAHTGFSLATYSVFG